jgi:hypothetical protein
MVSDEIEQPRGRSRSERAERELEKQSATAGFSTTKNISPENKKKSSSRRQNFHKNLKTYSLHEYFKIVAERIAYQPLKNWPRISHKPDG